MNLIRVNFRTKKIRTKEDDRLFDKIKDYYAYRDEWSDLKLEPGINCFKDEELALYINNDSTVLNDVFIQKMEKHLKECDLCLAKIIKIEHG
ncbi:MAG: hypothetical protein U9Q85_04805 [Patescibacteria group bacterium]|nr:hypothetical protein [Patescibacteria group bacterium]